MSGIGRRPPETVSLLPSSTGQNITVVPPVLLSQCLVNGNTTLPTTTVVGTQHGCKVDKLEHNPLVSSRCSFHFLNVDNCLEPEQEPNQRSMRRGRLQLSSLLRVKTGSPRSSLPWSRLSPIQKENGLKTLPKQNLLCQRLTT